MAKLKTEAELTKELKAYALKVANELPKRLLKGDKATPKATYRKRLHRIELDQIEASYNQLDGEWRTWLEVARRYERKVPSQDRYDIRHTIILELHKARQRDEKPLPLLRAYRIASLMVALYWRQRLKRGVKVCIYTWIPVEPYCGRCNHKPKALPCPYLAIRPIQSLDQPTADSEGNECRLIDTIADDKVIDLDLQVDASTWLLGCPIRLIEILTKKRDGVALNKNDQKYLERYRRKTQISLF